MSAVVSLSPKGMTFVRSLITSHTIKNADPARVQIFAHTNWGAHQADRITKAVVSALTTNDFGEEATEFFSLVRDQSLLGRLVGLRRVPFNVRMLSVIDGTSAYWVRQGGWKPLSKPSLEGDTLEPMKVVTLIVATEEAMRVNPQSEAVLLDDMKRALTDSLDGAFLDPANAGIADEMPPSVTFGVTPVSSTGDPSADLTALVTTFDGDFSAAYFVTDPTTATQIALARDAGGSFAFPDAGPRGGSILGIPLIVTRGSPRDSSGGQLALIDPTGIAANVEGIRVQTSNEATLQMRDDPTSPATTLVSLFQTDSVAWIAEAGANWDVQRAGSVAIITGVDYA